MAAAPLTPPLRLQLLASAGGALLFDRVWGEWPLRAAPPAGVAALVQASRQAGGELAGGELRRLVVDAGAAGGPALELLLAPAPPGGPAVRGALWQAVAADSSPERDDAALRFAAHAQRAFASVRGGGGAGGAAPPAPAVGAELAALTQLVDGALADALGGAAYGGGGGGGRTPRATAAEAAAWLTADAPELE